MRVYTMSKNIVFIVDLEETYHQGIIETKKRNRRLPFQHGINTWKHWTKKNNVELFILTQRVHDELYMNANWHKTYVFDLLEANKIDYDQILIADADTCIHPNAPNMFELTDRKFCVVQNYGNYDWVDRSITTYQKEFFTDIDIPLSEYFNSGVVILNKDHKSLYETALEFYHENQERLVHLQNRVQVGTDQPVMNFLVKQENIDVKFLPFEWNSQSLKSFGFLLANATNIKNSKSLAIHKHHANKMWIFHFNGMIDQERETYMKMLYQYYEREYYEN